MSKIKSSTFSAFQVLAVMIFAVVCCLPFTMVTPKAEAATNNVTIKVVALSSNSFSYGGVYDSTKMKFVVQFIDTTSGALVLAKTYNYNNITSDLSETITNLESGMYVVNVIAPTFMKMNIKISNTTPQSYNYSILTTKTFTLSNTGAPVIEIGANYIDTTITDDSWLTDFNVANA
ncbi:MAG: hypothetical protein J6C13_03600 [Clostridia bacterium]|nr:hypothetical protein [Clostridia bacterium]